jgi:hypothetical protein
MGGKRRAQLHQANAKRQEDNGDDRESKQRPKQRKPNRGESLAFEEKERRVRKNAEKEELLQKIFFIYKGILVARD